MDSRELYDRYQLSIQFRNRLVGGCPKSKDMIKPWIEARTGHADEQTELQAEEAAAVLVAAEESCWTGFMSDADGIFIHTRNIKAMIKQCASVLGICKQKIGSKQIFAEGSEVKAPDGTDRIHLGLREPTGSEERPIHVMTAKGPRNALKRVDFVERPRLNFEIWVLKTHPSEKRHVGKADLDRILMFAQENGLGADRSQGEGKFDVIEFAAI